MEGQRESETRRRKKDSERGRKTWREKKREKREKNMCKVKEMELTKVESA
jgi:hypothetical protein